MDAVDHHGFRAAHYAFWKSQYWGSDEGGAPLLRMLLDAGAADSPALAAARGDHGALRAFVEADPAAANEGEELQKRPLSAAAERGHREMVRYLLDRGADPALPEGRQCPHGFSLTAAAVKDDVEMARWLLEAGADPNGGVDSSGTPAILASSDAMRGLLYGHGGRPVTAWDFAQRGDLLTLAVILNYCDDPFSAEESEFLTTPYTAVVSGCLGKLRREESTVAHEAMLSMLLQRRFPMPEVLTECKGYLYRVPHMTRQLLEHGLDPNLHDWQRRTRCTTSAWAPVTRRKRRSWCACFSNTVRISTPSRRRTARRRWAWRRAPAGRGSSSCFWRTEPTPTGAARTGRGRWPGLSAGGTGRWRTCCAGAGQGEAVTPAPCGAGGR